LKIRKMKKPKKRKLNPRRSVDILIAHGKDYAQYMSPCEGAKQVGDREKIANFFRKSDRRTDEWLLRFARKNET
jgi:hypothetical protein